MVWGVSLLSGLMMTSWSTVGNKARVTDLPGDPPVDNSRVWEGIGLMVGSRRKITAAKDLMLQDGANASPTSRTGSTNRSGGQTQPSPPNGSGGKSLSRKRERNDKAPWTRNKKERTKVDVAAREQASVLEPQTCEPPFAEETTKGARALSISNLNVASVTQAVLDFVLTLGGDAITLQR